MDSQNTFDRLDPNDPVFGSFANQTGITPLGYKMLLELPVPADLAKAKANGIEIPDSAMERHTQAAVVARVIQIGNGCYREDRFPEGPWCKVGDYVAMSPYNGTRLKSTVTGLDYRMVNEDSIDAVVVSPDCTERG